jgi:hypothetical protein
VQEFISVLPHIEHVPSSDVITPPHEPYIGLFLRINPIASAENAKAITINVAINVLITQDYTIH